MHEYLLCLITGYIPKYLSIFYNQFVAKTSYKHVGYYNLFRIGCKKNDAQFIAYLIERKEKLKINHVWEKELSISRKEGCEEIAKKIAGIIGWRSRSERIYWACRKGDTETFEELRKHVDCYDILGAIHGGNIEMVRYIVENSDRYYAYNYVCGFIVEACVHGHLEIVNFCINKGAKIWDGTLCAACMGGNVEIIDLIIEKGGKNWNMGLKGACLGGHEEIVRLMIINGANNWDDGFYIACRYGHTDIAKQIITYCEDVFPECACKSGNIDLVKFIMNHPKTSKSFDAICSAIKAACIEGHMEVIRFMTSTERIIPILSEDMDPAVIEYGLI